jgi:hypothetical protein
MVKTGTPGSLPVFFRAAEGVGVLLLVIVFIATGSLMNRKVPRTVRNPPGFPVSMAGQYNLF